MNEEYERTEPESQSPSQNPLEGEYSQSSDFDLTGFEGEGVLEGGQLFEEEDPRSKPFLSRMLNRAGIRTGHGVDWMIDWLQVLIIAGLLAWGTMSEGMVRMRVPTGSMIPTIQEGDSFFVDKFTYRVGINNPEPGDIVVFWHTDEFKKCQDGFLQWKWGEPKPCKERYVKRLVAIGPAEVRISMGKIYVNGLEMTDIAFDRDYVCRNREHRDPTLRNPDECAPFDVPEGEFFVLGDNTRNSSDSRYWGTVESGDFIGEPFFRVWPFERIGPMNSYFGSAP